MSPKIYCLDNTVPTVPCLETVIGANSKMCSRYIHIAYMIYLPKYKGTTVYHVPKYLYTLFCVRRDPVYVSQSVPVSTQQFCSVCACLCYHHYHRTDFSLIVASKKNKVRLQQEKRQPSLPQDLEGVVSSSLMLVVFIMIIIKTFFSNVERDIVNGMVLGSSWSLMLHA